MARFAIDHARRRILHFDVTDHPTAAWVVQKLREAFPYDAVPRHLFFDRDSSFSAAVVAAADSVLARNSLPARLAPSVAQRFLFLAGTRTGLQATRG